MAENLSLCASMFQLLILLRLKLLSTYRILCDYFVISFKIYNLETLFVCNEMVVIEIKARMLIARANAHRRTWLHAHARAHMFNSFVIYVRYFDCS